LIHGLLCNETQTGLKNK